MGSGQSMKEEPASQHFEPIFASQKQIRASIRSKTPMPTDPNELERRFTKVLTSMDLPPDKAKLLKQYDDERKWDIICDQERVHAKDPPTHYLNKLRTYLDPKASRSSRKTLWHSLRFVKVLDPRHFRIFRNRALFRRDTFAEFFRQPWQIKSGRLSFDPSSCRTNPPAKEWQAGNSLVRDPTARDCLYLHDRPKEKRRLVGDATSTQVLRDLEISLRTNHIEWVREFLNESNLGLDSLVNYLSFRLEMMRYDQRIAESRSNSEERIGSINVDKNNATVINNVNHFHMNGFAQNGISNTMSPTMKKRSKHMQKLNMGQAEDDIHVCIKCLRALMNNKYGFNMVMQHREAINCIALSLTHKSLRTKALVLELLAAICLVKGGHEIILSAFDNLKEVCGEKKRFRTLMDYFYNYQVFHIEFMVACMQFVNIVVHSVEDMNFRVHLQVEFTALGLDDYLEKLRLTESEELQVQISAYLDNVFDVNALMEDSETKTAALEKVAELEDELGHAHDRLLELQSQSLNKISELELQLKSLREERDCLLQARQQVDEEVNTLRRVVQQHEQESKNRQSVLENKIMELETLTKTLPRSNSSDIPSSVPPPPPPPPAGAKASPPPPPPPPPPCPAVLNKTPPMCPVPPPAPGSGSAPDGAMTIKKKVLTKYKLPTLNWIALKPNQVRGTVFNDLDDDKLHSIIDFSDFEERFKIGINSPIQNGSTEIDGLNNYPSKRFKKPENITLLEHTRLRNIAISRRKLEMPVEQVISAVNSLDLRLLSLENVEILQRMVPTEQETKAYREYVVEKKNSDLLTEEDKYLLQLGRVERLSAKLSIMGYIGNFFDNVHLITPQIQAIISASSSVINSKKLKKILEIILAFGNYLNSSKRGPAYGFKLQGLDTLVDTKSTDKRMCLLHYIVETIRNKFPDLLNFEAELLYIDKAATVSLENVITDVHELEKGMELVRKEHDLRGKERQSVILRDFLNNSEEKLKKLKADTKTAQETFKECVEFFGESPRTTDANTFFSLLVRFTRSFKLADQENEQRRRLEMAANMESDKTTNEDVIKKNKMNQKRQQEAVINELKAKTRTVEEKKLLHQDEVYNGALEDILLGLKSEPYRRADAVRRSHRRKIDNNRLSRTFDEIEC